jgi:CubicO group peptidase (beta-lactamase class C family)
MKILEEIEKHIASYILSIDNEKLGFSIKASKNGQPIFGRCLNSITEGTSLPIASLSKPLFASGLRVSAQKDIVGSYTLNHFKVGIDDFINHTSGIPEYIYDMPMLELDRLNLEETCRHILSKEKLETGNFHYSNSNYTLLSQALLNSTGISYNELVRDAIFSKVNMCNSFSFDDELGNKYDTALYLYDEGRIAVQELSRATMGWGDSAFFSTTEDLIKWTNSEIFNFSIRDLLAKGSSKEYLDGYFLGSYNKNTVIFHTGSTLGAESLLIHLPSEDVSIVYLSNHSSSSINGIIPRLLSVFSL